MHMKCPLKVITEELKEFNYYKPGDYLITGLTSKIFSQRYPYVFSEAPTHRLKRYLWTIKIIVFQLDFQATAILLAVIEVGEREKTFMTEKVWIATTLSYLSIRLFSKNIDLQCKHVLFSFLGQTKKRGQHYNFNSYSSSEEQFVKEAFQCSFSRSVLSKKVWERCREKEKRLLPPHDVLAGRVAEDGTGISKAIQAVALVLNAASSSQLNKRRMRVGDHQSLQFIQPWQ
ncbi:hypothetical protein E2320_014595, partial [Naja naja]